MDELPWLDPVTPVFPPTSSAFESPDGLLALGGNLSTKTLIQAYAQGIFPWYSEGEPIMWWAPKTRAVMFDGDLNISRGSRKQLRKLDFTLTTNRAFSEVIIACAEQRKETGTWITEDIVDAYVELHRQGVAKSVEVWREEELVGGLYGIKLGAVFCGESMFNRADSAAKFAFFNLAWRLFDAGYAMIDCQIPNKFLSSMGVKLCTRERFEANLAVTRTQHCIWPENWEAFNFSNTT